MGQERLKVKYFLRRCWHEGISKASVVQLAGASAGLESERRYVTAVLPAALLRNLRHGLTGDMGAFMRFAMVLAGLTSTATGYLSGKCGKSATAGTASPDSTSWRRAAHCRE